MSEKKTLVFKALYIITWVIFVGLAIEAGGLIVNFVFSLVKPEWVGNLYQKLDLSKMYDRSLWAFYSTYSFILFIALAKAYLFYIVIKLLHKMDLAKPFSAVVSKQISRISYWTLAIGLCSHAGREILQWLMNRGYDVDRAETFWVDSQAFIIMAAILYIIAAIFAKGVEIQNENDLTV